MQAEKTLSTSIKEKETHWHRRAVSPLHHKATILKMLMETWRVSGSTRLQGLAVRSIIVFNSTPRARENKKPHMHGEDRTPSGKFLTKRSLTAWA
eukprot:1138708-Pelagomonas_calceolata.AAC.1